MRKRAPVVVLVVWFALIFGLSPLAAQDDPEPVAVEPPAADPAP